jgi:hypothetical protein
MHTVSPHRRGHGERNRAQQTTAFMVTRARAQVERFFDGVDLLDPGLVEIQLWRPDEPNSILPGGYYGGVGRKR